MERGTIKRTLSKCEKKHTYSGRICLRLFENRSDTQHNLNRLNQHLKSECLRSIVTRYEMAKHAKKYAPWKVKLKPVYRV